MIRQCGTQMWAVGTFTSIGSPGHTAVTRNNIFAFDQATGAMRPSTRTSTARSTAIAFSPDCSSAYIGGVFTSVARHDRQEHRQDQHGHRRGRPRLRPHRARPGLRTAVRGRPPARRRLLHKINGSTGTTACVPDQRLHPTTGKVDGYASNLAVTGTLPQDTTHIYKLWPSPDGTRVAVDGVFTSVARAGPPADLPPRPSGDLGEPRPVVRAGAQPELPSASRRAVLHEVLRLVAGQPVPVRGQHRVQGRDAVRLRREVLGVAELRTRRWSGRTSPAATPCTRWRQRQRRVHGGHERWAEQPARPRQLRHGMPSRGRHRRHRRRRPGWPPRGTPPQARGHGAATCSWTRSATCGCPRTRAAGLKCAGVYHPGICVFPHS